MNMSTEKLEAAIAFLLFYGTLCICGGTVLAFLLNRAYRRTRGRS